MHSPEVDSFLPRIHALIVATVTLLSALIVAESHSASNGVLVDRIGRPLRGVTVELEHAGVNGTTDASGRWVLDASSRIGRLVPARDIRWEAGRLIIGATREQMAKLSVFDVRGMRLTHDMTVRLVVGKNGIVLPEIPSGLPARAGTTRSVITAPTHTRVKRHRSGASPIRSESPTVSC